MWGSEPRGMILISIFQRFFAGGGVVLFGGGEGGGTGRLVVIL